MVLNVIVNFEIVSDFSRNLSQSEFFIKGVLFRLSWCLCSVQLDSWFWNCEWLFLQVEISIVMNNLSDEATRTDIRNPSTCSRCIRFYRWWKERNIWRGRSIKIGFTNAFEIIHVHHALDFGLFPSYFFYIIIGLKLDTILLVTLTTRIGKNMYKHW